MWKLLRNLVLAAIFVAGALKLLAWYAVRQDSQRVVAELAAYAQLQYTGVSAGLNGSVTLDGVTLTTAATHLAYHARRVTLTTPGLHWLLRRALLHENNLPQQFGIAIEGLQLPSGLSWLNREIFDPQIFVPFAALGCGGRELSAVDLRKMGLNLPDSSERLDYRYNDDAHTLSTTLTLTAPGFTRIVMEAELARFDPTQLHTPGWFEKLRLNQATAEYTDLGYLRVRNRFCAKHDAISESQFVDRHITDARTLLLQHGITPSDSLTELYRTLLSEGGQVSVLSLPSKDFIPGSWRVLGANEVWRQLNVTSRYQDSPPIMFGLEFANPPTAIAAAPDDPSTVMTVTAPPLPGPATPPKPEPAAARLVAVVAKVATPAPISQVPKTPLSDPTTAQLAASAMREPIVPPPKPARDSLGLGGLDRAEARLAPLAIAPTVAKPQSAPVVFPSSPPPPPNSTLALVWKPVIDELPETIAPAPDYTIIDFSRLARETGRRVRLVTNGNNKIEGYVIDVDVTSVQLRVDRGDGDAQFSIPRSRIEQIQLIKR